MNVSLDLLRKCVILCSATDRERDYPDQARIEIIFGGAFMETYELSFQNRIRNMERAHSEEIRYHTDYFILLKVRPEDGKKT